MKVKIGIAIAALILVLGALYTTTLRKSSTGISPSTAAAKIATYYNAHATTSRIVKSLRCIQGKQNKSAYLCAAVAVDSSGNPVCLTVLGEVTAKTTKIQSFAVDQMACYFAA